jgi:hypothetical protein
MLNDEQKNVEAKLILPAEQTFAINVFAHYE